MTLDFTNPADYLLAMLPEVVLSIWAMLVLLVDVFRRGSRSEQSGSGIGRLVLAGVLLAAAANGWLLTLDESGTSGVIALDAFRVFTNFLILLAVALFVVMADRYLDEEHLRYGELYVLVLFAAVGMMVFAGSRELMVIFIGLELLSVPVYVRTGATSAPRKAH
jgi:NADH-quinone oxidoreductase subunit N